ncbi:uncharacterized protein LOC126910377 isoform X2 [Daktulosphaira vitifoliae]|uniref:uncharacterized protein LOC126910377 isoform X2 n=1 Tax=Daktulosphaira vitifoliae TaxID=58002 RepID=UPI0021AA8521|nr:uncharacterized protein LOC126910377 isoform X2 [Daktulosphaira vitifoliae]
MATITYKGRRLSLWICITCHGLLIELISYFLPEIDNFWHSQSPIMLFGHRLPLHILLVYPVFYYLAIITAYRKGIKKLSLMLTVGLNVLLLDIPFDMIGVKFIHWTWHDTDPNIFDRVYLVPCTSYFFYMTTSASFTYWFFNKEVTFDEISFKKEIGIFMRTIMLSFPCGVICFSIFYHPLHDIFYISTQTIVIFLIALYNIIVKIIKIVQNNDHKENNENMNTITIYLVIYYTTFFILSLIGKPENEISTGIHEEIGPCNITVNAFNTDLIKRKYLCIQDYNEEYDFHCIENAPAIFSKIYTICGKAFENRMEYVIIISTIAVVALIKFNNSFNINKITKKKVL